MPIVEERLAWLDSLYLSRGSHESPEQGACVSEAVSYVAGEPFSDHPECASPVITEFLVSWNDSMNDEDRQMLVPYIPRIVGTRTTPKDEQTRAWLLTDWLARECAPAWLRLAGLTVQAEVLEGLAPLKSAASARKAQPALDQARKDSVAAWAAAGDAAWDASRAAAWAASRAAARAAAGDAAGDAARAAAGDAAWDAAWDAARDAARAAAGDAARAAAGAAARAAARDAARAAAWAASRAAARDAARAAAWAASRAAARDAARAAAGAALAPTTKGLQTSALLLLDRMITVGKKAA